MFDLNKFKDLLSSLPEDVQKTIQAYADSRVAAAIQKTLSNQKILPNAVERLKQIEAAADKKISELELKNKVLRTCFEKGLSFDSVDRLGLSFKDDTEIEIKLSLLSKDVELKKSNDFNQSILLTAHRPGSGKGAETPLSEWEAWKNKLPMDEQIMVEKLDNARKARR